MSNNEKKVEKEHKKKARYEKFSNFNRTRVITWLAYALIIAVVVLTSSLQMVFDIEHFDWIRFVSNLCFSLSIAILAIILAIKDGEITNESKKKGDYYDKKCEFSEALKLIVDRDVFRQYCDILYIRERQSYVNSNLATVNIYNDNYLKISDQDLEVLRKEPKYCVVGHDDKGGEIIKPLDNISEVQFYTLKKYRDGDFKYPKIEYTFFTSRRTTNSYKYQASLQQKQRNVKALTILFRCLYIIVMSTILSLSVINPNEVSGKQIAFDVISRIFTFVTSMSAGYTVAYDEMRENIDALQYKIDTINQYSVEKETGSFKPLNLDEQVKMKIEKIEADRKAGEHKESNADAGKAEGDPPKNEDEQKYIEIEMTQEEYEQRFGKKE